MGRGRGSGGGDPTQGGSEICAASFPLMGRGRGKGGRGRGREEGETEVARRPRIHSEAEPREAIQAKGPRTDRQTGCALCLQAQDWPFLWKALLLGPPAQCRPEGGLYTQVTNPNAPSSSKGSTFSWMSSTRGALDLHVKNLNTGLAYKNLFELSQDSFIIVSGKGILF